MKTVTLGAAFALVLLATGCGQTAPAANKPVQVSADTKDADGTPLKYGGAAYKKMESQRSTKAGESYGAGYKNKDKE